MGFVLSEARASDAHAILRLREATTRWLVGRDIAQWRLGEVSLTEIEQQIAANQWLIVREEKSIAAGFRLLKADPAVWGEQPPVALYLHGLMVDRAFAGRGMGSLLLYAAETYAQSAGRDLLRLDCVETNQALRDWYAGQGFTQVGRRVDDTGAHHPVVLLEKICVGDEQA